ncbi:conserved membrane hypothetical protein [Nitrospina gracilis 3/211]|uniref:Carotenoid biosynthesis protein n=1 Tax=Nitrospina gracilis (strain 3/211) TaxID=1266370 RepID=M1YUQ7_NITG3|nr:MULTISPECIES: carotenoid biosynthesis protein [Nitrospina]MCF8722550.1 putative membrane protein [Nitrospina sp. Nb-3]CCQ89231.1 conserved membrane hypothetical protein [Nitrospina gracilis 3/211]
METFNLLIGTVLLRPYVFVFLAIYLTLAVWHFGAKRAALFTVIAYCIAFLSEYSSTRNGFPYGYYSYIDTTRDQELWIANVPFMDSLSYSFLTYVAYTMALFLFAPLKRNGWDIRFGDTSKVHHSLKVVFSGAVLFMLMDVVIDPVAFRGDRWFLGKIYTYQEEGEYFNIPLTNFGGWVITGAAILFTFTRVNRWLESRPGFRDAGQREVPYQALLGPALYFGVLLFNLAVTFYIGEGVLGLCGTVLTLAILGVLVMRLRRPDLLPVKTSPVIGE